MSPLLGLRVRFRWPDGHTGDATGEIIHVSWGEDGTPGVLVRWEARWPGSTAPGVSFVRDVSWLVADELPPAQSVERVQVAGGVL